MQDNVLEIRPQPGFQEKVFGCTADIAVIGGSAGGGKTCALIVEPLKWIAAPDFAAVFFRRTMERIRATGGLLSESKKWYIEGQLSESVLKWKFPSGAMVDFEGIEHSKDLEKWRGTQIPLIVFDELTEFEEDMFWFMISRNRGIVKWIDEDKQLKILKPYVRASCNPKPNSWVSRLLEWYINQETGYPIEERDGKIRYFIRFKDKLHWGDTKDEVIKSCPEVFEMMKKLDPSIKEYDLIKSFTFIRGKLSDNKILTRNSPEYYSSLLSLSAEDQQIFLEGNWKVSSDGTDLFEFAHLRYLFDVEPQEAYSKDMYITCDAARFGQDLCVIYVWSEWTVIHISVFYLSDNKDIFDEIELQRKRWRVLRSNTMVDQDGLGGDVVKLGKYQGFQARAKPAKDPDLRVAENYRTFKDQCYYHFADKVNSGVCKFLVMTSTVKIFDRGKQIPRYSMQMKWRGDMVNIKELIINQISAIKKGATVLQDGGEAYYTTNSKEEQRELLQGASPDLADPGCIRAAFDLVKRRRGVSKLH